MNTTRRASPTPVLKLRKDIWERFPVNLKALDRGADGRDRYGIEWHNMKVRTLARERGVSEKDLKAAVEPRLLRALGAASDWTVEAPGFTDYIAIIAMGKPKADAKPKAKPNATRKAAKKAANQTRKSKTPTPPKKAAKAASKTRKNLGGEEYVRKVRAIINKVGDANQEKMIAEILAMKPKTAANYSHMIEGAIMERVLDTQAYHPFLIRLLHKMSEQNKEVTHILEAQLKKRFAEEPRYALLEVTAEESNAGITNSLDTRLVNEKRFYRGATLFLGYMYLEGLLGSAVLLKDVLAHLESLAADEDGDYRVQDAAVHGILYILIRAGPRLQQAESALFAHYHALIEEWSKTYKRNAIRLLCADFVEAVAKGYVLNAQQPWAVGAPAAAAAAPAKPQPQRKEGLGADVGELWRRFPVEVKQVGETWVVRFHGKKLAERFAKESGKYKTQKDLETFLHKRIVELVENSTHWKKASPTPAGAVIAITAA